MPDTSTEVLLDDFEHRDDWAIVGSGATQTHLTTFVEGAPAKRPGVYADGERGADHRAVVLLIRSATEGFEVELAPRAEHSRSLPAATSELRLWIRSPHADVRVWADLAEGAVPLGSTSAAGEWIRLHHRFATPIAATELRALRIRLDVVTKQAGEVMILLDDLTALTA
ncbi:hypothetical protein IU449_25665 [Nocardia higoensis]|uniref:Uncharacterized protein n=1 Tax=Nocardia higoensis TaxID=228599 RepID=A0ABS0DIC7_9NOCA|nr:hypothetical protein [Nocardia higoensis]MBF6357890.1 hypothetical protein [Nocardia higoensis]